MDRFKRRIVVLSLGCVVALAIGSTGTAIAVPPHQHCMSTPQGWVEVGPRVAKQPHLHETAFHQFHFNVHVGSTTIVGIAGACSSLPFP